MRPLGKARSQANDRAQRGRAGHMRQTGRAREMTAAARRSPKRQLRWSGLALSVAGELLKRCEAAGADEVLRRCNVSPFSGHPLRAPIVSTRCPVSRNSFDWRAERRVCVVRRSVRRRQLQPATRTRSGRLPGTPCTVSTSREPPARQDCSPVARPRLPRPSNLNRSVYAAFTVARIWKSNGSEQTDRVGLLSIRHATFTLRGYVLCRVFDWVESSVETRNT